MESAVTSDTSGDFRNILVSLMTVREKGLLHQLYMCGISQCTYVNLINERRVHSALLTEEMFWRCIKYSLLQPVNINNEGFLGWVARI